MRMITKLLYGFVSLCLLLPTSAWAIVDPLKPDTVSFDTIEIAPGQSGVLSLRVLSDDTTFFNGITWRGVGSFCIPLKYQRSILRVDSVNFVGTVAKWDEKFSNPKVDTGFISLAGIFNLAGAENPALYSPDSAEAIAKIYFTLDKKAAKGSYTVELTIDPIQKELYFGSSDGFNSWRPVFIPGKIKVK